MPHVVGGSLSGLFPSMPTQATSPAVTDGRTRLRLRQTRPPGRTTQPPLPRHALCPSTWEPAASYRPPGPTRARVRAGNLSFRFHAPRGRITNPCCSPPSRYPAPVPGPGEVLAPPKRSRSRAEGERERDPAAYIGHIARIVWQVPRLTNCVRAREDSAPALYAVPCSCHMRITIETCPRRAGESDVLTRLVALHSSCLPACLSVCLPGGRQRPLSST